VGGVSLPIKNEILLEYADATYGVFDSFALLMRMVIHVSKLKITAILPNQCTPSPFQLNNDHNLQKISMLSCSLYKEKRRGATQTRPRKKIEQTINKTITMLYKISLNFDK
jgi:hypothetical protein